MPKVIVTVPQRPQFDNAYWCLKRRFETGATVIDVTDAELAELQEQPVIAVTLVEDVLTGPEAPPAVPPVVPEPVVPPVEPAPVGKPMKR